MKATGQRVVTAVFECSHCGGVGDRAHTIEHKDCATEGSHRAHRDAVITEHMVTVVVDTVHD